MRPSSLTTIVAAISIASFSTTIFASSDPKFTVGSTWMLPGTASDLRWVEIHKIEGVGADALYHVSVLRRLKADPVWNLKHVVAHMAITGAALSRSVAPAVSHMGAEYPETYEEGYREWLGLREKGNPPICDSAVMECAHL
jgi:Domain of unknown function (DUF5086)